MCGETLRLTYIKGEDLSEVGVVESDSVPPDRVLRLRRLERDLHLIDVSVRLSQRVLRQRLSHKQHCQYCIVPNDSGSESSDES